MTEIIKENRDNCKSVNLLALAGTDISHFFHKENLRPKKGHPYLQKFKPKNDKNNIFTEKQWQNDKNLIVGQLTEQEIKVRIINTLTF